MCGSEIKNRWRETWASAAWRCAIEYARRVDDLTRWSDAELLGLAAGRHADAERAFETLYRRHRDMALRVARRFARDDAEAMDAVQEAFIYLARNLDRLARPGGLTGRLSTLLYPVVKNSALALARKSKRLRFGDGLSDDERTSEPRAETVESTEERAALAAALAALPEGQREVLLMRTVDGMSVAEVARALDIPEGTVKSRLFHAAAALRKDPRTRAWFDGEAPPNPE